MRSITRTVIASLAMLVLPGCAAQPSAFPSTPTPASTPATPTEIPLVGKALDGGGPVYRLMENGQIRHISDMLTFLALGYSPGDVIPTPIRDLGRYPLGMPLTRWVAGETDHALYYLQRGKRYPIHNADELRSTGGSPPDVSLLPDDYINAFPQASSSIPDAVPATPMGPSPTAATWHNGGIWVADDTGGLTRWDVKTGQRTSISLPDGVIISALADDGDSLLVGAQNGLIGRLADSGETWGSVASDAGWVSALAPDRQGGLWYASSDTYDLARGEYQTGQGLVHVSAGGEQQPIPYPLQPPASDPTHRVTVMAYDAARSNLWIGTSYAGLLRYNLSKQAWASFTIFTQDIPDTQVNDLKLAADGSLWIGTFAGVTTYRDKTFEVQKALDRRIQSSTLSLQVASDGSVWTAGENYVSRLRPGQPTESYTTFDHLFFRDRFISVMLDEQENPWVVGSHHLIHFDGQTWRAYDTANGDVTPFAPHGLKPAADGPPRDFPSPQTDYRKWLETWPRPQHDNGRCIHYLQTPSGDDYELRQQLARMERLHLHWVLVNYTTRSQLIDMAPRFKEAGIIAIWRPYVRPYQVYYHWAEDVAYLRALGIPPYMQVYNEASIPQEWDGQPVDQEAYFKNLLPAVRAVYDAGGYVGLQDIQPAWTKATLDQIKAGGMDDVFDRVFFVPHPYGANHPPDYDQDITSVLGFREYARIFQQELGFVPVMIAGEGGWRIGDASDNRFPPVSEELHGDYNAALYGWFSTGILSDGESLPDYLLAFCPWLLSDPADPAAWFDGPLGDLTQTIQRVEAMPDVDRLFSWQREK